MDGELGPGWTSDMRIVKQPARDTVTLGRLEGIRSASD